MPFVTRGRGRRLEAIVHVLVTHILRYSGKMIDTVSKVVLLRRGDELEAHSWDFYYYEP